MSSSASKIANTDTLLQRLGRQVHSQSLLYNLALLNRRFNAQFSPFLYHDVCIQGDRGLRSLLNSAQLGNVKSLTVSKGSGFSEEVNDLVQQLLLNTPSLQTFKWIGLPLATKTINTLHRCCSDVKSIHISYPVHMDEEVLGFSVSSEPDRDNDEGIPEARELYNIQDFTAFTELNELTVHNIGKDLSGWKSQLSKILEKSRSLQKLGLSISVDTIARAYNNEKPEKYEGFFDSICDEYAARGGQPLHLQSLRCGTAVYPQNEPSLKKLTDLSYLEELHIQNKGVEDMTEYILMYDDDDDEEDNDSGIVFDAFFSPESCNLRRFTASQLQRDVYNALESFSSAGLTRQLAISFEDFEMTDYEMARLLHEDEEEETTSMQLRMMDLELKRDTGDEVSALQVLSDLVSSNSETLEGLMVHLPENPTVEYGFDHLDGLQDALQNLPKVTQLVIGMDTFGRDRSALTDEKLNSVALKLANAVPHLQYINVYWKFWRIWQGLNPDSRESRWLEELDVREREHVELFGHTIYKAP